MYFSFCHPEAALPSKLAVADGPGERKDVTDIAHAGQVHDAALEAQAKAGVPDRTVFAQIQVELVLLLLMLVG